MDKDQGRMTVSIIIVCKNEERHIAACVEAALRAASLRRDCEVVLVDSCSTDETVSIASRYPIAILQLRPEWRHTPPAGRWIGTCHSSGEYLLFVDGDSVLQEGFLEEALARFARHPRLAAVHGRRWEVYWKRGVRVGEQADFTGIGSDARVVPAATGTSVYRRAALVQAGGFNPFLYAEEEAELGERVREAGYEILAIPVDMIDHHTVPREDVGFALRRLRNNMYMGVGQVIRYRLRAGRPARAFLQKGARAIEFAGWMLLGCAAAAASLGTRKLLFAAVWAALTTALILGFMAKSRSLAKPFKYALIWAIQAYSLQKGFRLPPQPPSDYPTDALVLKKAPPPDRGA
jgi:glycosyltransferase involved in cell wall biosynthesis